jgi:predicted CXXCH cytochrome family protein
LDTGSFEKSHLKEGNVMKRIALISAALVIASAVAATAAPMTIKGSRHDMKRWNGSEGTANATNGEICIYCHTPHNAILNVPLWNRNNPSSNDWKLYNTSATITSATKNSFVSADSISLFCMSCHDGITALGDLKNKNELVNSYDSSNNGWGVLPANSGSDPARARVSGDYAKIGGAKSGANTGGYDLGNTHPIGFDYYAAQAEDSGIRDYNNILNRFKGSVEGFDGGLKSTAQNFTYARPVSDPSGGSRWFECASCHRVHDPGPSGNFLRLENGGSQLCLACHDK